MGFVGGVWSSVERGGVRGWGGGCGGGAALWKGGGSLWNRIWIRRPILRLGGGPKGAQWHPRHTARVRVRDAPPRPPPACPPGASGRGAEPCPAGLAGAADALGPGPSAAPSRRPPPRPRADGCFRTGPPITPPPPPGHGRPADPPPASSP